MTKVLLLISVLWAVCTCGVNSQPFNDTMFALLSGQAAYTRFLGHAGRIGLNLTLKDPYESLTVFVPSNAAFERLPQDVQKKLEDNLYFLTEVMSFHLYQGPVTFSTDNAMYSSLIGAQARVNVYKTKNTTLATVLGVPVTSAKSLTARNGFLHLVDKVLYPIPTTTALNLVSSDDNFSKFSLALSKAGVMPWLNDEDVTILVPDDAAIDRLPAGLFSTLLENIPTLTWVLHNHLVQGVWYSAYFLNNGGGTVDTVDGRPLNVKVLADGSTLQVGQANVTQADISVTNGVVHVISQMLLPPDIWGRLLLTSRV